MTSLPQIQYDRAQTELLKNPYSLVHKHRMILALARSGSTDLALSEYNRLGLHQIDKLDDPTLLEDIMALPARLYKDKALASSGEVRAGFARKSSQKYTSAFKATNGYYSGINAATMSLLAGQSKATIDKKAKGVLDILPVTDDLQAAEKYFVEATRAEAYLLLGQFRKAHAGLTQARLYDPLNYTTHASSLKQFQFILDHFQIEPEWQESFSPPKALHYAGHIFSAAHSNESSMRYLSPSQQKQLRMEISDIVQTHDIGFGYGALAAGGDILIAETLLEEGAELHIILPAVEAYFCKTSVAPYGRSWIKRYRDCLKQASSVRICDMPVSWPNGPQSDYANKIMMGLAVMHAGNLSSEAIQLLIWDGDKSVRSHNGTNSDFILWQKMQRPQIVLPFTGKTKHRNVPLALASPKDGYPIRATAFFSADINDMQELASIVKTQLSKLNYNSITPIIHEAGLSLTLSSLEEMLAFMGLLLKASGQNNLNSRLKVGLYWGHENSQTDLTAQLLSSATTLGSILVNEAVAATIAGFHDQRYEIRFQGTLESLMGENHWVYTLILAAL